MPQKSPQFITIEEAFRLAEANPDTPTVEEVMVHYLQTLDYIKQCPRVRTEEEEEEEEILEQIAFLLHRIETIRMTAESALVYLPKGTTRKVSSPLSPDFFATKPGFWDKFSRVEP